MTAKLTTEMGGSAGKLGKPCCSEVEVSLDDDEAGDIHRPGYAMSASGRRFEEHLADLSQRCLRARPCLATQEPPSRDLLQSLAFTETPDRG